MRRKSVGLGLAAAAGLTLTVLAMNGAHAMGSAVPTVDTPPAEKTQTKPTGSKNYRKAVELINESKYEDAIKKLNKVERTAPNDPDVLNYLGYAHRKLGKNAEALAYYERALASDPDHKGAREYLGELYLQMGELDKAEEQLAVLDHLCKFGCAELESLKTAISDYKAKASTGTAPGPEPAKPAS